MGDTAVVYTVQRKTQSQVLLVEFKRKGVMIYNDSDADLFVIFGAGPCTPSKFSTVIKPKTHIGPFSLGYGGEVHGCWATAGAGVARITELRTA